MSRHCHSIQCDYRQGQQYRELCVVYVYMMSWVVDQCVFKDWPSSKELRYRITSMATFFRVCIFIGIHLVIAENKKKRKKQKQTHTLHLFYTFQEVYPISRYVQFTCRTCILNSIILNLERSIIQAISNSKSMHLWLIVHLNTKSIW